MLQSQKAQAQKAQAQWPTNSIVGNLGGQPLRGLGRAIPSTGNAKRKNKNTAVKYSKKESKMQSIKRWIRNWLSDEQEYGPEIERSTVSDSAFEEVNTVQLRITPARGGLILSVRHYDRRTDNHLYTNYVIHETDDTAKNITDVLTMELLRAGN
jgi:hypothetical protein